MKVSLNLTEEEIGFILDDEFIINFRKTFYENNCSVFRKFERCFRTKRLEDDIKYKMKFFILVSLNLK